MPAGYLWKRKDGLEWGFPALKPLHSDLEIAQFPNSDKAHDHALSIPPYPSLSQEEADYIIARLEQILRDLDDTKLVEQ